ncbi:hypothetical protein JKP88DRAFT_349040 [Tribonema minus]|uniref:Uncharacterized protein n=1 Tax=Tribonema minus TaxID=303371 RepID=A0A835YWD7_9STRA|nr:hypothetical protein JKP88DRAFT_349040 [Tribonema minus]
MDVVLAHLPAQLELRGRPAPPPSFVDGPRRRHTKSVSWDDDRISIFICSAAATDAEDAPMSPPPPLSPMKCWRDGSGGSSGGGSSGGGARTAATSAATAADSAPNSPCAALPPPPPKFPGTPVNIPGWGGSGRRSSSAQQLCAAAAAAAAAAAHSGGAAPALPRRHNGRSRSEGSPAGAGAPAFDWRAVALGPGGIEKWPRGVVLPDDEEDEEDDDEDGGDEAGEEEDTVTTLDGSGGGGGGGGEEAENDDGGSADASATGTDEDDTDDGGDIDVSVHLPRGARGWGAGSGGAAAAAAAAADDGGPPEFGQLSAERVRRDASDATAPARADALSAAVLPPRSSGGSGSSSGSGAAQQRQEQVGEAPLRSLAEAEADFARLPLPPTLAVAAVTEVKAAAAAEVPPPRKGGIRWAPEVADNAPPPPVSPMATPGPAAAPPSPGDVAPLPPMTRSASNASSVGSAGSSPGSGGGGGSSFVLTPRVLGKLESLRRFRASEAALFASAALLDEKRGAPMESARQRLTPPHTPPTDRSVDPSPVPLHRDSEYSDCGSVASTMTSNSGGGGYVVPSEAPGVMRSGLEVAASELLWLTRRRGDSTACAGDGAAAVPSTVDAAIAAVQAAAAAAAAAAAEGGDAAAAAAAADAALPADAAACTRASLRARSMSPRRTQDPVSPNSPAGATRHRSALSELIESEIIKRLSTMHDAKVRTTAVTKFNANPKDGIRYLVEQSVIRETPQDVCEFLVHETGLSKRKMGEYFGRNSAFHQQVFELFLGHLDFKGLTLDEALRRMVVRFRMPGEAQQIDRIMEHFAKRWFSDNPDSMFSCVDTAYILAFSLMMLNTDMYNRNLREGEKMTVEQFCNNNRGIDQGKDLPKELLDGMYARSRQYDLPKELLEGMYARLRQNEIRMDEGDMFESEVITFVAPKISGWLRKKSNGVFAGWKRHWFVLVDGVLYYFFAPQDEAPRCIIPLERITVQPVGKTDLTITAVQPVGKTDLTITAVQGLVKSVKMMDDGRMEQGSHKEFVLRAEKQDERDRWLLGLRSEASASAAEPLLEASTTPARGGSSHKGNKHMRRRTSFEKQRSSSHKGQGAHAAADVKKQVNVRVPPPCLRGWARTQNEGGPTSSRRYCAIFKGVESAGGPFSPLSDSTSHSTSPTVTSDIPEGDADAGPTRGLIHEATGSSSCLRLDVLYFFGSSEMCDRMVDQQLHTSHGRINLADVVSLELRNLAAPSAARPRTIILYTRNITGATAGAAAAAAAALNDAASACSSQISLSSGAGGGSCLNVVGGRRWILVPEDHFEAWVKAFMDCCPQCGTPLVKDDPLEDDPLEVDSMGIAPIKTPPPIPPTSKGGSPNKGRRFSVGTAAGATISTSKPSPRRSILGMTAPSTHSKQSSAANSPF